MSVKSKLLRVGHAKVPKCDNKMNHLQVQSKDQDILILVTVTSCYTLKHTIAAWMKEGSLHDMKEPHCRMHIVT